MSGHVPPQTLDAWVAEQLAGFAPLGPADLAVLATILGYENATKMGEQQ